MKRVRISLILILVLMLVVSCALLKAKPYSEMTPQEKVLYALKTYNAQYADYLNMAVQPGLTAYQKVALKSKKQALSELWPLINQAKLALDEGKSIELTLLSKIGDLVNRLLIKI